MTAIKLRRPRRVHATSVMLVVGVLLAAAAALLPIAIIVLTAFKPIAEVNAYPPTLVPDDWTLENFARIFEQLPFARLILNSVVFAGGVTLFALVFDSLAAYALARIDFRGSRVLLIAIIASLMIPFQALLIPVYQLVADLGWINTFAGLIAPRAADAFGIFFLRQFFLSLPRDLDNAARIDGASSGSSAASSCRTRCRHCSHSASSRSSTTGMTCSGHSCSRPTPRWAPSPRA